MRGAPDEGVTMRTHASWWTACAEPGRSLNDSSGTAAAHRRGFWPYVPQTFVRSSMSFASGAPAPPRRSATFVLLICLADTAFDGHGLAVYAPRTMVVGR